MSKKNILIVTAFICGLFLLASISIGIKFIPTKKALINSEKILGIKVSAVGFSGDNYYRLDSIQGSKDIQMFKFKSERIDGEQGSRFAIYDRDSDSIKTVIPYEEGTLNLSSAVLVEYIKDNLFIVVDSHGKVFKLKVSKSCSVEYIATVDVKKDSIFKYAKVGSKVYLLSRDTYSDFNELSLGDNAVTIIDLSSGKVESIDIPKDSLVYSFVSFSTGDVGVLYSDVTGVSREWLLPRTSIFDKNTFLKYIPIRDGSFLFQDREKTYIKNLTTGEVIHIQPDQLVINHGSYLIESINRELSLNIGDVSNIPVYIHGENIISIKDKFFSRLIDKSILQPSEIISSAGSNDIISDDYKDLSYIGDPIWFDYKGHKMFIRTTDGLHGISKKNKLTKISDSNISYMTNKYCLYEEGGEIYYKTL